MTKPLKNKRILNLWFVVSFLTLPHTALSFRSVHGFDVHT
jgi:hypothetical protein